MFRLDVVGVAELHVGRSIHTEGHGDFLCLTHLMINISLISWIIEYSEKERCRVVIVSTNKGIYPTFELRDEIERCGV